jgi:hypothetical protein
VKNCVGVFGLPLQHLDCFDGGQNKQFDFVTLRFAVYFLHQGQSAVCTNADDELAASAGDFLFYREWRVAELLAKLLGEFFLAPADSAAIDDDIVFVRVAIDLNGGEIELVEARTPGTLGFRRFSST